MIIIEILSVNNLYTYFLLCLKTGDQLRKSNPELA